MPGVFTLDTVGISFPVSDYDCTGGVVQIVNYGVRDAREHRTVRHQLPSGGFVAFGKGPHAWLEASLPKAEHGSNVDGVSAGDAVTILHKLHAEALVFCQPTTFVDDDGALVDGNDVSTAWVKRLDVVRDFHGVPVRPVLDALERTPRFGRKVLIKRFADPEAGGAETLRVGTRSSWSCVLYDKHAETGGIAAPGHLRYEARLRSKFLTGSHASTLASPIVSVCDIADGTLATLGVDRFHAAGFGVRVSGEAAFRQRLEALDLSSADYMTLLGYLSAVANGYPVRMSRNTVAKYRRLARSLGVVPGEVSAVDAVSWLDLAAGELLTTHGPDTEHQADD
nr:MAG TPA: replication protein [Inoviridae sp.]